MRTTFLAVALGFSALSAGNPLPQDINLDAVIAAPDPTYTIAIGATGQVVPLNTAAAVQSAAFVTSVTVQSVEAAETAAARLAKKDTVTCAPQPSGATGAPTYSPSAASDFAAATAFGAKASSAPTPPGYDRTFVNLAASNNAYGYMGFTTLQDYDTLTCAAKCTAMAGCSAVNIYYERDPSLDPGTSCPDPAPVTMIKCVFWGGPVTAANALNVGQYRTNFHVVIAGSNGYTSQAIATPAGYTLTGVLGTSAINAPYDSQGYNTYMGFKIFTQGGYNVQFCADYCTAQNNYNMAYPPNDGSPIQLCQFFDTYILYKNTQDQVQGQYCAIYSEPWDNSYATNNGQYRGSDFYGIYSSYTYTNSTGVVAPNKNGAVHQASKDIVYSSLQTYCSTLLGYQPLFTTATVTTTVATITAVAKRTDVGTPDVLTKYPASVRSSACSLVVTSPTVTSTTSTTVSITATVIPSPTVQPITCGDKTNFVLLASYDNSYGEVLPDGYGYQRVHFDVATPKAATIFTLDSSCVLIDESGSAASFPASVIPGGGTAYVYFLSPTQIAQTGLVSLQCNVVAGSNELDCTFDGNYLDTIEKTWWVVGSTSNGKVPFKVTAVPV